MSARMMRIQVFNVIFARKGMESIYRLGSVLNVRAKISSIASGMLREYIL